MWVENRLLKEVVESADGPERDCYVTLQRLHGK